MWFPIALGSYFLNALAAVIDKMLLKKRFPDPIVYTFYTGILSVGVVVLVPFGFSFIPVPHMLLALFSGALLLAAFYFFYQAIKMYDATRVVPLAFGIFTPVLTLLLSWVFLGTAWGIEGLVAFVLFVTGGLTLMADQNQKKVYFHTKLVLQTFFFGFLFSASLVIAKIVYEFVPNFFNAFIWMRLGSFLVALLLLSTSLRKRIKRAAKHTASSTYGLFFINKIIGALGFVLLNYAVKIGSVSFINALKGIEYFFVFVMMALLTFLRPSLASEIFEKRTVIQKIVGITAIGFGAYILYRGGIRIL